MIFPKRIAGEVMGGRRCVVLLPPARCPSHIQMGGTEAFGGDARAAACQVHQDGDSACPRPRNCISLPHPRLSWNFPTEEGKVERKRKERSKQASLRVLYR